MISHPLVSVCVPTRNRAEALRRCLEDIGRQDYDALEILVSDNGSEDETPRVCEEAARRDPRIRCVRHPANIGLYRNHNFCLEQSRGELLCFFHDHDERDPRIVREYVTFLAQHPEVGVVCADWELIDEGGRRLGVRAYPVPAVMPGLAFIERTIRSGRCAVATPGAMVRRVALSQTRFDPEGPIGFGDFPVWFRVAERWAVGHIPACLWRWRQTRTAQSARTIESMAQDYHLNLSRYCDEHLSRFPQHQELVARWKREIRRYLFWALAFEVGLYCRKDAEASERPSEAKTLFEILQYRLSPEAFERTLEQLETYRTGSAEQLTCGVIQMLVRLKLTAPLAWATHHAQTFRQLLMLQ